MSVHEDDLAGVPLARTPLQARSRAKVLRALAAAEALLENVGPDALTLTSVAREAGLTVGALYPYLPDREAIVRALTARYHARMEALMAAIVAERVVPAGQDPVGEVLDAFAGLYRDQAGIRSLREAWVEPSAEAREHKARMAEHVHAVLVARGILADDEAAASVARTMFLAADAVMHEAFRVERAGNQVLLEQLKEMLRGYLRQVAR